MDLQTLHSRTGLSLRKLRYVVDHELVPGMKIVLAPGEAGRPRQFADDIGWAIACAAALLESGVQRTIIPKFLEVLRSIEVESGNDRAPVIPCLLRNPQPAEALLADGTHVKLTVYVNDFGWRTLDGKMSPAPKKKPRVTISIDLGQITREILGE